MGILLKLCCRDLLHRKLRLGFTILAIAAVSCLMIWFVGSLDLGTMMQKDVVRHTFGEYSLAMFRDDGFSEENLKKLSASEFVESLDCARQTDPEVSLNGVEYSTAAFRQNPKITGIDQKKAPFTLDEGRWFENPGECVVSSTAAAVLLRGSQDDSRQVQPGDSLTVKTNSGEETVLTVVGTFKQTAMQVQSGRRRGPSGTFVFGFGQGIGGASMGKPSAPTAQAGRNAGLGGKTDVGGNAGRGGKPDAGRNAGPGGKTDVGGNAGRGGKPDAGGNAGPGGKTDVGGNARPGGKTDAGRNAGRGGKPDAGGNAGRGGKPDAGGNAGPGGKPDAGGNVGLGGKPDAGGNAGPGGKTDAGGNAGPGGMAFSGGRPGPGGMESGGRRKAIRGPWSGAGVGLSAPAVYVSLEDQHRISGTRAAVNLIFVKLRNGKTPEEFYAAAEKIFGKSFEELSIEKADALTLQAQQDKQQSVNSIFAQAWSAMGIVIVTAVLIIFTTLNMDVSERTRYLAMLRTLGLTRSQVAWSIILEGLMLGVLGWLLGMLAGWGLLEYLAFRSSGEWIFLQLSGTNILLAFLCTLAGAFAASIVPAIRATFVSPVESMVRQTRRFAMKDLFLMALLGVILLGTIPYIVFLPMAKETRGLLFGTLGTFCFGAGFLLFFPWTIAVTERVGAPILAFLCRFDARFLKNQLAGNQLRSLMTALIMSLGLGLYTAILIWSSSMLYRFVIQDDAIPFALVRMDDVITSDEAAAALRAMPGVDGVRFMQAAVAQPQLEEAVGKKMSEAGAMNPSVVVMGIDAELAYSAKNPMLNLRFTEGSREEAHGAMEQSENGRVCVVTSELAEHAGFRVGDSINFSLPGTRGGKMAYAAYQIVGVVDFPGMLWFTKFGNVRVGAGRCCALAFAPYETVQKDFRAPENEFFWFDTAGSEISHEDLKKELQKVVHQQVCKNFLPETDAEFEAAELAKITQTAEAGLTGANHSAKLPEMLVSLHPGAVTKDAAFQIRALENLKTDDILYVNSCRANLADGGAAILYGVDPQLAFRAENPVLGFKYAEGSAKEALKTFFDADKVCVVTQEFAAARGLKVGDRVSVNLPQESAGQQKGRGAGGPGMAGAGGPGAGREAGGPGIVGAGGPGAGRGAGGPGMAGAGGPGAGRGAGGPGMAGTSGPGAGRGAGGPGMAGPGGPGAGRGAGGHGMAGAGGPGAGHGAGGPGMAGPGAQTVELTIAAIVEFPEWETFAKSTGSLMRRNVETLIFTTPALVKDEFKAKEFQHYWLSLTDSSKAQTAAAEVQKIAKASAVRNREADSFARRDMLRQMQGAAIASVESVNASLASRAGSVIEMMTKMPLIMLAISTIAILNTMIVSVFTRRWEMGVLRACGVTRGGLVRLILAESVLIGLCAIAMSFLFGVFYSWLLINVTSQFGIVTPPLVIPWEKIAFGFGLTVLLCILASLYPAFVTGRKEPIELLRRKN